MVLGHKPLKACEGSETTMLSVSTGKGAVESHKPLKACEGSETVACSGEIRNFKNTSQTPQSL